MDWKAVMEFALANGITHSPTGEQNDRRAWLHKLSENLTRRRGGAEDVREVLKISLRSLWLIIPSASFARDPERELAAAFCYARFELFGSPSANCVIPLAALASLPPSINQSAKIRLIRKIRVRVDLHITIVQLATR
ncbi:MAG: hypothetical protein IJQ39_00975 [Thermoguttaceae bacterium]|nr:hypothetical protein [Thermoguttaceae bacterium]